MEKIESKTRVSDVLKAYWQGTKPQKWTAAFTLLAFTIGQIFFVIIPLFYKKFFDVITNSQITPDVTRQLVTIIIEILVINIIVMVIMRSAFLALNSLESKTMARLKQSSFDYMINHSYSFFTNSFTGSLVQRVNRFSRSYERFFDTLVFNLIPLTVAITGSLIVVYLNNPFIAGAMLIWLAVVMTFSYLFSRWKVKYDVASAKADTHTTAVLADDVTNQNAIILFDNFKKESKDFKSVSNEQAKAQRLTWNLSIIADVVQITSIIVIEFVVFYYAIKYWSVGLVTVGTFVLIQSYILNLSNKLWDLSKIIRNLHEVFADSKEMVEILRMPHEIRDIETAKELSISKGAIEFKDVHFNFNQTRPVLENFDLSIKGGEKVALIGPSGAGKSTIVKTLLRLYELTSGKILIDGQDIKTVTQGSLHRNISLVPQDPVLFHRSLKENIRYGRPEASDEEVVEAAKLAHCDEFIDVLPLKYDTLVGERGIKLSGGERQRVAIARAILKNAPILVLDEATSSLDSHSESLIQDALDKLMKGKTSIVIAHRLSTIRKMDRIVVIEGGKVIEDGPHDELLAKESGLYKKLWNLQAGGFIAA